jgi:hypothetical protein
VLQRRELNRAVAAALRERIAYTPDNWRRARALARQGTAPDEAVRQILQPLPVRRRPRARPQPSPTYRKCEGCPGSVAVKDGHYYGRALCSDCTKHEREARLRHDSLTQELLLVDKLARLDT